MEFDWDEANEKHLARHGVSRREAEDVLTDPLSQIIDSELVDEELRYRQIGSTADGRILIVIFTMRNQTVRPITGFEAGGFMARLYRHGFVQ
jgi:uncharacterized DUF497 family protein